jgi:hypothetical protein
MADIEKRGACDCCGLCLVGSGEAIWSRPFDGASNACLVADFAAQSQEWRDWPETWHQAVEGCHITFWTDGKRILGKRMGPDRQWLYPSPEIVDA